MIASTQRSACAPAFGIIPAIAAFLLGLLIDLLSLAPIALVALVLLIASLYPYFRRHLHERNPEPLLVSWLTRKADFRLNVAGVGAGER